MKRNLWKRALPLLFAATLAGAILSACGKGKTEPPPAEPEKPVQTADCDLMLFIGQSNMSGRGNASEAVSVPQGHAYEFRAVSDPTALYPLTEPFGKDENNSESGVSETTKTGSLVSAFAESYYETTKTPLVAVSCSKGGTGINFWDTGRPAYADAVSRLKTAQDFLASEGKTVGGVYLVWLQGETDAENGVPDDRYLKTLGKIFTAFEEDADVGHCFVIPIGGFAGSDETHRENYARIRAAQIAFCEERADATVVSTRLADLSRFGFMKDERHFKQEGYDLLGADAGENAGNYVLHGQVSCTPYTVKGFEPGGAYKEEEGRVAIPAAAAFENSVYASATPRFWENILYEWKEVPGTYPGAACLPDAGSEWNIGTGFERAPQLNFTFRTQADGKYYLCIYASHPNTGANSVLACVDGGPLIACATDSYGKGLWYRNGSWAFDLEAGEHTVTVCAREDGIVLHQIVLTRNAGEPLVNGSPLPNSGREAPQLHGRDVEVNGTVSIDLLTAFEGGEDRTVCNGYAMVNSEKVDYTWQHGSNGRGVQIYPMDKTIWTPSARVGAPHLDYRVEFFTPGDYYVFLYASFTDAESDSAMVGIDGGAPVEITQPSGGVGSLRWLENPAWKVHVPTAGVHTVSLYARESGATMHRLVLSRDGSGSGVGMTDLRLGDYEEKGGRVLLSAGESGDFRKTGTYRLFVGGRSLPAGKVTVGAGAATLSAEVPPGYAGWLDAGTFTVSSAGKVAFTGSEGLLLYAEHTEAEKLGCRTLVFGDSYTNKTYWQQFEAQMAAVGGKTIGVNGSQVADWTGRVREFSLYHPENIAIHLGVNDINRGKTGQACGESLVALLEAVHEELPEAQLFYVGICHNKLHSSDGKWAEYEASNEIVKTYAARTDYVTYIDFPSALDGSSATLPGGGFIGDGLHPNAEAYQIFARLIVEAIAEKGGKA